MTRDEARQFFVGVLLTSAPDSYFDMIAALNDQQRALFVAGARAIMPLFGDGNLAGGVEAIQQVVAVDDMMTMAEAQKATGLAPTFPGGDLERLDALLVSFTVPQQEWFMQNFSPEQMQLLAALLDGHGRRQDLRAGSSSSVPGYIPFDPPEAGGPLMGPPYIVNAHGHVVPDDVIDGVSREDLERDRREMMKMLLDQDDPYGG